MLLSEKEIVQSKIIPLKAFMQLFLFRGPDEFTAAYDSDVEPVCVARQMTVVLQFQKPVKVKTLWRHRVIQMTEEEIMGPVVFHLSP